jgi:hypothetical protein
VKSLKACNNTAASYVRVNHSLFGTAQELDCCGQTRSPAAQTGCCPARCSDCLAGHLNTYTSKTHSMHMSPPVNLHAMHPACLPACILPLECLSTCLCNVNAKSTLSTQAQHTSRKLGPRSDRNHTQCHMMWSGRRYVPGAIAVIHHVLQGGLTPKADGTVAGTRPAPPHTMQAMRAYGCFQNAGAGSVCGARGRGQSPAAITYSLKQCTPL